ncbi:hypothetical protein KAU43_07665 [candidate division WOR-3 bacterium]|nr:hypothetical protein [candidate division WOR-3 bacterium]
MKDEVPDIKKSDIAENIGKKAFKNNKNPLTDAFIEVLEEHPQVEMLSRGENIVNWRFKIDSEIFRENVGHFESYDHLLKDDQRKRKKLEKIYERQFIFDAKDKLGNMGVMKAVVKETLSNIKDKKEAVQGE